MTEIARFYGIVVRLYYDEHGRPAPRPLRQGAGDERYEMLVRGVDRRPT